MKKDDMLNLNDFDFGFSVVNEEELEIYQETRGQKDYWENEAQQWKEKAYKVRQAIEPLLKNLCMEPEKEYILWPNRVEKCDQFRRMLDDYLSS